jgi:hypothetical protein
MSYIVCHSNLVYVYVNYISHGKNKGPMNYNKYHGAFYLKKHVSHEHVEEGKKIKEMEINKKQQKKRKNIPPSLIT